MNGWIFLRVLGYLRFFSNRCICGCCNLFYGSMKEISFTYWYMCISNTKRANLWWNFSIVLMALYILVGGGGLNITAEEFNWCVLQGFIQQRGAWLVFIFDCTCFAYFLWASLKVDCCVIVWLTFTDNPCCPADLLPRVGYFSLTRLSFGHLFHWR